MYEFFSFGGEIGVEGQNPYESLCTIPIIKDHDTTIKLKGKWGCW